MKVVGLVVLFVVLGVVRGDNYEVCNVAQMGGNGDGETDNTEVLRKLFSECDEVIVPEGGVYLTHPVNITRDNFVFTLEGELLFYDCNNLTDWPVMPHLPSYPNDRDVHSCCRYQPNLLVYKTTNVTIQGTGKMNGQGATWWAARTANTLEYGRPRLLQTMYASKLQIKNITLQDSPFWTTHLWSSEEILVEGIHVRAPPTSENTDGVDPDSSKFVTIRDCHVHNGDDCIAIKSGENQAGIDYNRSSSQIIIDNVHCYHGFGISIGSEMSGGVEDVLIMNSHTGYQQIKTAPERGGYVKDITWLNNRMDIGPIIIDTTYTNSQPASSGAPYIDNIIFEGTHGHGSAAGKLVCDQYTKCTNFVAVNNDMTTAAGYVCINITTAYEANNHPKWCKRLPEEE
uniref:Pectate lyase superfamily protein domain-containing protein n=1 Tax=Paramoeba aestuarina TaxID=180227 RepID=A0A7S4UKK9_9EUKA